METRASQKRERVIQRVLVVSGWEKGGRKGSQIIGSRSFSHRVLGKRRAKWGV